MNRRRIKRNRFVVSTLLGAMLFITAGVGTAAAGCGWPVCRPANLAGSFDQLIHPTTKNGTISVWFRTTANYAVPETSVTFSGSSSAAWLGTTPFNAAKITLSDHFHVDGVSVNVTYPPGFSGTGADTSFTNSVSNSWNINHTFSNIKFTCFACFGISEDATATFKFGVNFWTIAAHDGALV